MLDCAQPVRLATDAAVVVAKVWRELVQAGVNHVTADTGPPTGNYLGAVRIWPWGKTCAGYTDEQTDGQIDGWMDKRMDRG